MVTTNNLPAKTPRKLFRGAFHDLEPLLAAEIAAHKKQLGPLAPLHVLCPTRLLALHLSRSLPQGHINVRFTTLTDFASQISHLPSQTAPPLGLQLLCRRIALDLLSQKYFAPIHDTVGFAAALLDTFTDFDEAGLDSFPGKTPKLRELAIAHAEFRSWLAAHNFHTEADLYQSEISNLQSPILLYGFYDLNAVQRRFVERLAPAAVFFPAGNEFTQPLLRWLTGLGYTPHQSPISNLQSPISLLSCPGEAAEVREAVRAILAFLRDHPGKTFNDCAILCRSRDQYDAILRDTLPALGIPAYFRGGRPLSEHPDARRFLLLLEVLRTDYSRAAVMELACHVGPNSHWDALTVELGIVGGRDQWQARLRSEMSLTTFINELFAATTKVAGKGTWASLAKTTLAAWQRFGGVHERVRDAIAGLAELDAIESPVEFATFAEFCQKALDAGREQTARFQGGGVFVSDVMGARGLSFDCVVVLGMVEKSFPRLIREDPLLLDRERTAISPALPLKSAGHAEERMLFDLVRTSARDALILSYPRLDAGTARPRVPSFLLLEATGAANFKEMPCRHVPLSAFAEHEPAVDERDLDLPVLPATEDYLAGISPLLLAGVRAEQTRWRESALTAYDGLTPGVPLPATGATTLEDFFGCPFFHFLKHVLHLEPWEEPEAAVVIDPSDLGTLYHRILEVYFRDGGDLVRVIEEHLRQFEQRGVTGYPTVWEIKKEIVRQEIIAFVAREQRRLGDEWRPGKFEQAFETPVAPLVLRGKIDRVDFSADGRRARVFDYKTGKVPAGLKDDTLAGGEALQLPLYLLAAENLWPGVTIEEAGYLYFTLRGGYRAIRFGGETLKGCRQELAAMLGTAVKMIEAGQFAQYATKEGCARCDFRAVCGNGIVKLAERKANDPRLKDFRKIKGEVA